MSVLVRCPSCSSDDIDLIETKPDTRKRVECRDCGHVWLHGVAAEPHKPRDTFESLKKRFPGSGDVDQAIKARADSLKVEFLSSVQVEPDTRVAPYWTKYQHVFSPQGLPECDPQDLKDFANSNIGAHPGNMSVFNDAWNTLGPDAAAERTREAIEYLLRGPEHTPLEDRLTTLIEGTSSIQMTGFKESLLTKVLCVMQPERFLTILKYTGEAGKREIARTVYGLELPDPNRVTWTIGRLILWSNDVLVTLVGEGFANQQHAAHYLWWAKDQT